jgi:hypothetical protein
MCLCNCDLIFGRPGKLYVFYPIKLSGLRCYRLTLPGSLDIVNSLVLEHACAPTIPTSYSGTRETLCHSSCPCNSDSIFGCSAMLHLVGPFAGGIPKCQSTQIHIAKLGSQPDPCYTCPCPPPPNSVVWLGDGSAFLSNARQ